MSRDIGTENRTILRGLAEALIPAGNGMASAGDAGVAEAGIDRVLAVRPDIFVDLVRALALARNVEPVAALETIASRDTEAWHALRFAVFGAYYNTPLVQQEIGYAGQPAMPFDPDAVPEYLPSLERVIARGRIC